MTGGDVFGLAWLVCQVALFTWYMRADIGGGNNQKEHT